MNNIKDIKKLFKKLKTPSDVYNPTILPLDACTWFNLLSDRSRGKTTQIILLGMCDNAVNGTKIEYIRSREEYIAPKIIIDIFSVIKNPEYKYIEILTNGKYNTVIYKSRRFYYATIDEKMNITDIAPEYFMHVCSVDKAESLKSGYATSNSDFIIYDEFIGKFYYKNEFVQFCDLLKTLLRDRSGAKIFMLSNTIDRHSPYFEEMLISDDILNMQQGDKKIITTPKNTNIYVEILGKNISKKRHFLNMEYFGFDNPALASITGAETWAFSNYQHLPDDIEIKILHRGMYIKHNNVLVALDIIKTEKHGTCIFCHKATRYYDDSIIYSIGDRETSNFIYGLGVTPPQKIIWELYKQNKFYYATNDVGYTVENYVLSAKKNRL